MLNLTVFLSIPIISKIHHHLRKKQQNEIYLDPNATTPIYPEVLDAMLPYLTTHFGNPSSGYVTGEEPRNAVNIARKRVLSLLRSDPSDTINSAVMFCASGTESDNTAILLAITASKHDTPHVITTTIEHPAVLNYAKRLVNQKRITLTIIGVDNVGRVNLTELEGAILPSTCLVSVMHVNNEVGTIAPLKKIGAICKKHKVLFHSDAAQSAGKIEETEARSEATSHSNTPKGATTYAFEHP